MPSGSPASRRGSRPGCTRRSCATPPPSRILTSSIPAAWTARSCSAWELRLRPEPHNLVIIGPTGIGKSYLACAFVERACRRGHKAAYVRLPRLLQQLAVARGDGSYARILDRLQRLELLAIDDWLLAPLRDPERRDLVEVIEDRSERASTLVASQLPAKDWHASIGDPNLADAICDRVLNNAHRIEMKGPSMRRTKGDPKSTSETKA